MLFTILFLVIFSNCINNNANIPENGRNEIYRIIKNEVDKIWIIDTHEHLMPEEESIKRKVDIFSLFRGYAGQDLARSGFKGFGNAKNIEEKWNKFYPFWEKTRNTSYSNCVLMAVKGLFGADDINENTYKDVYIDMCWMHIISQSASKMYLGEWLETVPSNKIFAFGGDYQTVEGVYGHSVIARQNITEVLAKKVKKGYFTEEQAIAVAKRILRENALELYKLKKTGKTFRRIVQNVQIN